MRSMDSQWLHQQFLLNPERSKSELAQFLGLEPSAVSKMLKNRRQIKAREYMLMRKFFGLPVESGNDTPGNRHYILDEMAGGKNAMQDKGDEPAQWQIPASILSKRTKAQPEQIKVIAVEDNMMKPDYNLGEFVMVDLSDKKPAPPGVFLVTDGFGHMLRHCSYIPRSEPPKIKVSANDADFHAQILREGEFEILARVIAKLQWT